MICVELSPLPLPLKEEMPTWRETLSRARFPRGARSATLAALPGHARVIQD